MHCIQTARSKLRALICAPYFHSFQNCFSRGKTRMEKAILSSFTWNIPQLILFSTVLFLTIPIPTCIPRHLQSCTCSAACSISLKGMAETSKFINNVTAHVNMASEWQKVDASTCFPKGTSWGSTETAQPCLLPHITVGSAMAQQLRVSAEGRAQIQCLERPYLATGKCDPITSNI